MIIRAILNRDGPIVAEADIQPLRLTLEGPASFGQADGPTLAPFSRRDLSTVLRALDVNRGAPGAFTSEEVQRLLEWGVMHEAERFVTPAGWVTLGEADIDEGALLDLAQARLYATLFPAERQRALLHSANAITPQTEAIHIRLEFGADEIDLLQCPWEVLCYAGPERWNGRRVSLSRYLRFEQPAFQAIGIDRLRVLVITSRPRTLAAGTGADRESIGRAVNAEHVELIDLPSATFKALSDHLNRHRAQPPHVIHFDGHGVFGRKCGSGHVTTSATATTCPDCGAPLPPNFEGWLAFESEDGGTHWVSGDDLRTQLLGAGVQLAVLSACQSSTARRDTDVFNGVAQNLIRSVPAVVASQFRLDWIGAVRFADYFYTGLAAGEPLVEVIDRARQRLYGQEGLRREWYRTALYLRYQDAEGGQLFKPLTATATEPAATDAPLVFLHNINPPPPDMQQADFVLDWSRHFDYAQSPRRVPTMDAWERELMPELKALPAKIGRRGLIRLKTTASLTAGLAFGYVFREVGRYQLAVEQITSGRATVMWRTDEPQPPDQVAPEFKVQIEGGRPDATDGIVLIRALPNSPLATLKQAVLRYVAQADGFDTPIEYDRAAVRELLTDGFNLDELKNVIFDTAALYPARNVLGDGMSKTRLVQALMEFTEQRLLMETLLAAVRKANSLRYTQVEARLRRPRYKALLTLDADWVRLNRPLESWEALPLARSSRWALMDFIGQSALSQVHVFLATPVALAVFLGHQWNAIDCPIRCHEWIQGGAEYAPACLIGA